MKSLVWEGPEIMTLRSSPEPEPGEGEVAIEVAFAGICGSELGGYLGHNALRVPPLVMGHEFSGKVVALGAGVAGFAQGDRVTVNPMVPCGSCAFCTTGLQHLCTKRSLVGAHRPGAFADIVAVPAKAVSKLPAGLSLRTGAMVEPFAVAIRIGRLAGDVTGKTLLVIGAGPIGLLALQVLRAQGASQVFVADLDPDRLAMAEAMGGKVIDPRQSNVVETVKAATDGLGAHVTLDAVGTAQTRAQSVAATRSAGLVQLSGLHAENSDFPASEVIRREITVQGTFCYTAEDFADAITAAAEGTLTLEPWIVEAPLGDGGKWFDRLVHNPGNVSKVLLVPDMAS